MHGRVGARLEALQGPLQALSDNIDMPGPNFFQATARYLQSDNFRVPPRLCLFVRQPRSWCVGNTESSPNRTFARYSTQTAFRVLSILGNLRPQQDAATCSARRTEIAEAHENRVKSDSSILADMSREQRLQPRYRSLVGVSVWHIPVSTSAGKKQPGGNFHRN